MPWIFAGQNWQYILCSGKLTWEKTFVNWWKIRFSQKNFCEMLTNTAKWRHASKFRGENFYEQPQNLAICISFVPQSFLPQKISPWKVSRYTVVDEWMKQAVFHSFSGRRKRLWNCLLQLVSPCGGMVERHNWHIWKQSLNLDPSPTISTPWGWCMCSEVIWMSGFAVKWTFNW